MTASSMSKTTIKIAASMSTRTICGGCTESVPSASSSISTRSVSYGIFGSGNRCLTERAQGFPTPALFYILKDILKASECLPMNCYHLKRTCYEFEAGNLYLGRSMTGALVGV
jgi:hypothetical protein